MSVQKIIHDENKLPTSLSHPIPSYPPIGNRRTFRIFESLKIMVDIYSRALKAICTQLATTDPNIYHDSPMECNHSLKLSIAKTRTPRTQVPFPDRSTLHCSSIKTTRKTWFLKDQFPLTLVKCPPPKYTLPEWSSRMSSWKQEPFFADSLYFSTIKW